MMAAASQWTSILTEAFSFAQSVNRGAFNNDEETGKNPDNEIGRDDIYQNSAGVSLRHNFSPRTVGQLVFSNDYFDSDRKDTSRSISYGGIGSLTYALNARNRIGGGGGVNYQDYKGTRRNPGSETWTYRIFGSWVRTFGEDTELSIRLGPAFISNKQELDETENVIDRYPFVTTSGGGLGQTFTSAGVDQPTTVYTMTAPGVFALFPAMGVVAPNSLLVPFSNLNNQFPAASPCGGGVDGQTVFTQPSCPVAVVVDPVTNPAVLPVAATILGGIDGTTTQLQGGSDGDDTRIAVFGEISLTHRWTPNLSSALAYSRDDSGISSLGSTTIADRVTLSSNWNPSRRWNVNVRGDWVKRESATDSSLPFTEISVDGNGLVQFTGSIVTDAQNEAVDTEYWAASARASYRVTKRGTISIRLTYQNQSMKQGARTSNSNFENVLGFVGFSYSLDPFRF